MLPDRGVARGGQIGRRPSGLGRLGLHPASAQPVARGSCHCRQRVPHDIRRAPRAAGRRTVHRARRCRLRVRRGCRSRRCQRPACPDPRDRHPSGCGRPAPGRCARPSWGLGFLDAGALRSGRRCVQAATTVLRCVPTPGALCVVVRTPAGSGAATRAPTALRDNEPLRARPGRRGAAFALEHAPGSGSTNGPRGETRRGRSPKLGARRPGRATRPADPLGRQRARERRSSTSFTR